MVIKCFNDKREMAKVAADQAASILRQAIQEQDKARLITGTARLSLNFSKPSRVSRGSIGSGSRCFTWTNTSQYQRRTPRASAAFCRND